MNGRLPEKNGMACFQISKRGMIELKSADLYQLVSLLGWLRGTEALSALVLQKIPPKSARVSTQVTLISEATFITSFINFPVISE